MTAVLSVLKQVQIDELRDLRDQAIALGPQHVGAFRASYDYLYDALTITDQNGDLVPKAGVPHEVWLWLRGARSGYIAAAGKSRRYAKRALKLDNFSIEPTDSPIQSELTDVPSWMAAYRGGPKISETERRRRIDLIVRSDDPRSSLALTSIIRN